MFSQSRSFAILIIAISMLAIGLECTSAEECDYKTCGALMTRDGLVSWAVSGRRDYSPDTKRACAELNACVRRAKNNSAGRAAAAPAPGSNSLKSSPKGSATDTVARTAPDARGGGKFRATCGEDAKRFCVCCGARVRLLHKADIPTGSADGGKADISWRRFNVCL